MNKVIIAVVAIIVIGGAAFVLTRQDKNDNNPSQNTASSAPGSNGENGAGNNTDTAPAANPLDPNNYTAGADIGDTLDATDKTSVNVDINDFIFQTTYLKIKKGTKVTWTNQGQVAHDVTSAANSPVDGLGSQLLSHGDSYSFTFDKPGLYEYFCTPHPVQMKAVITVVE